MVLSDCNADGKRGNSLGMASITMKLKSFLPFSKYSFNLIHVLAQNSATVECYISVIICEANVVI